MVKVSTLNNGNIDCVCYKNDEDKKVIKIYFKICPELYGPEGDERKYKVGICNQQHNTFVDVTTIKK